jgi:predicted DNA-binding protein (UPF0278 family)
MTEYQGHRSKAAWNVALYISNEYALYQEAVRLMKKYRSANKAATVLMTILPKKTPDGFPYTHRSVSEAINGLEVEV